MKASLLSVVWVILGVGSARAHGGDDHGVTAPVVVGDEVTSVEASTGRLELLVRWPHPHEESWPVEAFLADTETNTPVEGKLELRFEGPASFKLAMEPSSAGRFQAVAASPPAGTYAVTAVVTLADGGDVLVVDQVVIEPEHETVEEDHHEALPWAFWAVLGGVLLVGLVFFGLMSRRGSTLAALLLLVAPDTRAGGGGDHTHEHEGPATSVAGAGEAVTLPKEAQFLLELRTGRIERRPVTPRITVTGVVTVPPGLDREVLAPLTGLLTPVASLELGRRVEAGEVLFTLTALPDAGDLASLRAEAAREKARQAGLSARVKQAQAALTRARALAQGESLARRDVEEAEAVLAEAKAALEASRKAVEALGEGGAVTLEVRSPIAGELVRVHAAAGQVLASTPLVRVVDSRELQVVARLLETDLGRVSPGAAAEIRDQGRVLTAPHLYTSPLVDPTTRAVDLVYRAPLTPGALSLKVNQVVTLALPVGTASSGLVVPDAAIVDMDGRPAVWLKRSAEVFEPVGVRVVARESGVTSVVGDLHEGDRVVVSGAAFLRGARPAGSR